MIIWRYIKKDTFSFKKVFYLLNKKLCLLRKVLPIAKLIINNHITKYPKIVIDFEKNFSRYLDIKYALTFNNGTSAFDSILFALNLNKGDKVLMSNLTFSSVVFTCLQKDLDIKFLDFDSSLNVIFPQDINNNVKAIIVTHVFGIPQNISKIKEFATLNNLKIIEDCSHAHGAEYKGEKIGKFSDAAFFSLQGDKAISSGEGGIAVTNDKEIFNKMRLYSHFGRNMNDIESANSYFKKYGFGKKGRMHPLAAGLASIDLKSLDKRNNMIEMKYYEFNKFISNFNVLYPINIDKDNKLGGFHHGLPFWIVSDKYQSLRDSLLSLKRPKFIPHPYINYTDFTIFESSNKFQKSIRENNSNIDIYKKKSNNLNSNKSQNRLLFLSLDSLKLFGNYEKKVLREILSCF